MKQISHRSSGRRTHSDDNGRELFNSWLILCHRVCVRVRLCVSHPWHQTHRISNSVFLCRFVSLLLLFFVRSSFGHGLCHFISFRFVRLCICTYIWFWFDYAGKLCSTTFDWLKCQYGFMSISAIVVNSNQCHTQPLSHPHSGSKAFPSFSFYLPSILPVGWWWWWLSNWNNTLNFMQSFLFPKCNFS